MNTLGKIITVLVLALLFTGLVFALSLLPHGRRDVTSLENIHGMPFPQTSGVVRVTEHLAHTTVLLNAPSFAQALKVTATFDPLAVKKISIGSRRDPFWLSYDRHILYDGTRDQQGALTRTIVIPLTDVLQKNDGSIDVMFFADEGNDIIKTVTADPGLDDTDWELHALTAETVWHTPSLAEIKAYVRGILKRERPL